MQKRIQDVVLRLSSLFCVVCVSATAGAGVIRPYVIYGDDDRLEVYEDTDSAHQILAESVVAIMDSSALSKNSKGTLDIKGEIYGDYNELCPTEKYIEQSTPAYCSGFLVADNIIATAGHCVQDTNFCKDAQFVFGFMKDSKSRDPNIVKPDDVYGCKRVLHEEIKSDGADFALVELDRPVVGRKPVEFAKKSVGINDSLFVIGHPVGLPMKIAGAASVRSTETGFFVANLDTFGGNSGSAVFNKNDEVAGILVRGEEDFVRKGICYVANRCANDMCRGEDATSGDLVATELAKYVTAPAPKPSLTSIHR